MKRSKFYITTPLYYVNSSPHIGHAYTNVICDVLARFQRSCGKEVFFLTGTDEYGQKIHRAAMSAGLSPQDFVDKMIRGFKDLWSLLNIDYTDFIRTTQIRHQQTVQEAVNCLFKKDDIYLSNYEGYYCLPCESFWVQAELVQDCCPDCGRPVDLIKEENYFFRLSKYQPWLIGFLKANSSFIRPKSRYNEVLSFLENNSLNDLCISRPKERLAWGIEFPFDNKYVVYVWFDALLNYISSLGLLGSCSVCRGPDRAKEDFWPADFHFIGKDILRQHAIYWPIMLKALGLEMPRCIFSHGWWLVEEGASLEKMSKSRGNFVNPFDIVQEFGQDAFRFFLLREISPGLDGKFSHKALVQRINSDLANDLGNLAYRTLNMLEKYSQGFIPECPGSPFPGHRDALLGLTAGYVSSMNDVNFTAALDRVWLVVKSANKSVEEIKPWLLFKESKSDELNGFMYSLAELLRIIAVFLYAFMPRSCENIYTQLGLDSRLLAKMDLYKESEFGLLNSGTRINKGRPLFPRIKDG